MNRIATAVAIATALTLGVAAAGSAQTTAAKPAATQHAMHTTTTHTTTTHHATTPRHHARVAEADARKTALGAVANGRVHSHTLTREHGRAVYAYVITVPGQPGSERVTVDAETGRIVRQSHMAPAAAHHTTVHHTTTKTTTTHHKR
jgi:uncharacterized membrane protein YkoI